MQLSRDRLTVFLKDAAKAHHEFEATTGTADNEWPQWYARYIEERSDTEETMAFRERNALSSPIQPHEL